MNTERDWKEDTNRASLDCLLCKKDFIGHRQRALCKPCFTENKYSYSKRCEGPMCLTFDLEKYKKLPLEQRLADYPRIPRTGSFIPDDYEQCDHCFKAKFELEIFNAHCCCDEHGYTVESVIKALRKAAKI